MESQSAEPKPKQAKVLKVGGGAALVRESEEYFEFHSAPKLNEGIMNIEQACMKN